MSMLISKSSILNPGYFKIFFFFVHSPLFLFFYFLALSMHWYPSLVILVMKDSVLVLTEHLEAGKMFLSLSWSLMQDVEQDLLVNR
jgi:hypothetical protein